MPCGMGVEVSWVPVRQTITKDESVGASDHVEVHVRLLPVIPPEEQAKILREELEARGWTRQPDESLTKSVHGAIAVLPPDSDVVTIVIERETQVSATVTVEGREKSAVNQQAEQAAAKKIAAEAAVARAKLVADNINTLEQAHAVVQREVNEAVNATTKRALEQKARELGRIESTTEQNGDRGYELTIVVKT